MENNYERIKSCPRCGGNKTGRTHSYGTYRVYESGSKIRLKCKSCGYILTRKIVSSVYYGQKMVTLNSINNLKNEQLKSSILELIRTGELDVTEV